MKRMSIPVLVCGLLMVIASLAVAQASDTYDLTWNSVYSSAVAGSGSFSLTSTVGQPEVGETSGGAFTVIGGFNSNTLEDEGNFTLYLPIVRR